MLNIIIIIIKSFRDSIKDIKQYIKQKSINENIIIYLIKGFISREKRLFTIAILELVGFVFKPFLWLKKVCYWFWNWLQKFFTKKFWKYFLEKLVRRLKEFLKYLANWVKYLVNCVKTFCINRLDRFVARARIYSKFTFRDHDRIYLIIIFLIFLTIMIIRRMSLDIAWDFSIPSEGKNAESYIKWSYNMIVDWSIHWILRDSEFFALRDFVVTNIFCFSSEVADVLVEENPELAKSGIFQKMASDVYKAGDRGLFLHSPPFPRWHYADGISIYYCIYTKDVYVYPPLYRFGFWLPQIPSADPDKFNWRKVILSDIDISYLKMTEEISPKVYLTSRGAKCVFVWYEFKVPKSPEDLTPEEAYQLVLNYSAHVVHELLKERFVYAGTHFTSSIDIEYEVLERMIRTEKIPFIRHVLLRTKELYYTPCPVNALVWLDIEFKKSFVWWWKLSRLPWVYYGENPPPVIDPASVTYDKILTVNPDWFKDKGISSEGLKRGLMKQKEILDRQNNLRIRDFRHRPLWPSQEYFYKDEPVYQIESHLPIQTKETLISQIAKMDYPTKVIEEIYGCPELSADKVYEMMHEGDEYEEEEESSQDQSLGIESLNNLENTNIEESKKESKEKSEEESKEKSEEEF